MFDIGIICVLKGLPNVNLSKKSISAVRFALRRVRNRENDVKCDFSYEIGDFFVFLALDFSSYQKLLIYDITIV